MSRPVTLFTGQWADLPLAELATKCAGWGFDGLELVAPGIVTTSRWHPEPVDLSRSPSEVDAICGIGRKA